MIFPKNVLHLFFLCVIAHRSTTTAEEEDRAVKMPAQDFGKKKKNIPVTVRGSGDEARPRKSKRKNK